MNKTIIDAISAIYGQLEIIERELATEGTTPSDTDRKVSGMTMGELCRIHLRGKGLRHAFFVLKPFWIEDNGGYTSIMEMTVSAFIRSNPPVGEILANRSIGKETIEKVRDKMAEFGFRWKTGV